MDAVPCSAQGGTSCGLAQYSFGTARNVCAKQSISEATTANPVTPMLLAIGTRCMVLFETTKPTDRHLIGRFRLYLDNKFPLPVSQVNGFRGRPFPVRCVPAQCPHSGIDISRASRLARSSVAAQAGQPLSRNLALAGKLHPLRCIQEILLGLNL